MEKVQLVENIVHIVHSQPMKKAIFKKIYNLYEQLEFYGTSKRMNNSVKMSNVGNM